MSGILDSPSEAVRASERITEKAFMQAVIDLARSMGWLVFHPHDSRRSAYGYPDLTMVHPQNAELVFAELKRENGIVSTAQQTWMDALAPISDWTADGSSYAVRARIWRPSDWPEIVDVLTFGRGCI